MSETIHLGIAKLATANTSAVKNNAPDIMLKRSIVLDALTMVIHLEKDALVQLNHKSAGKN